MNMLKFIYVYIMIVIRGFYSSVLFSAIKYINYLIMYNGDGIKKLADSQTKLLLRETEVYNKKLQKLNKKKEDVQLKNLIKLEEIQGLERDIDDFFGGVDSE